MYEMYESERFSIRTGESAPVRNNRQRVSTAQTPEICRAIGRFRAEGSQVSLGSDGSEVFDDFVPQESLDSVPSERTQHSRTRALTWDTPGRRQEVAAAIAETSEGDDSPPARRNSMSGHVSFSSTVKECKLCHKSYTGFGDTCADCRSLRSGSTVWTCPKCNTFSSGLAAEACEHCGAVQEPSRQSLLIPIAKDGSQATLRRLSRPRQRAMSAKDVKELEKALENENLESDEETPSSRQSRPRLRAVTWNMATNRQDLSDVIADASSPTSQLEGAPCAPLESMSSLDSAECRPTGSAGSATTPGARGLDRFGSRRRLTVSTVKECSVCHQAYMGFGDRCGTCRSSSRAVLECPVCNAFSCGYATQACEHCGAFQCASPLAQQQPWQLRSRSNTSMSASPLATATDRRRSAWGQNGTPQRTDSQGSKGSIAEEQRD